MYTFIHPTKTGGTAVEGYFKTFYPNHIQGEGHGNKCTANNKPIIIVSGVGTLKWIASIKKCYMFYHTSRTSLMKRSQVSAVGFDTTNNWFCTVKLSVDALQERTM